MTAKAIRLSDREENVMYDPNVINPCPFERRHVGSHGAFLLRINHGHVESVEKRIKRRRVEDLIAATRIDFS